MKTILVVAALFAVATAATVKMAPLLEENPEKVVEGSYIVVLNSDVTDEGVLRHLATVTELMAQYGEEENKIKHRYKVVLKGYSARMNDRVRDQIRLMPEVKYIQKNEEVSLLQGQDCVTSTVESWGIPRTTVTGRISPGDQFDYIYDDNCDGRGVYAYIIDTGVDKANTGQYFGERVEHGIDCIDNGSTPVDPNGHGTHVAGTVASVTYGLAPEATVVSVRVLNAGGSGTFVDVIAGIDFVAADTDRSGPKVINMSLGGGYYQPVIDAVEGAFNDGVHVVVAAGNENTDACTRSPAAAEFATTVGAVDITDKRATFSNYGSCTEIFGPGVNIIAPYRSGIPASLSGTSMASPHVAGVVAKYLTAPACRNNVAEDPQSVENYLISQGLEDILDDIPANTPNLLVHMPCPRGLTF